MNSKLEGTHNRQHKLWNPIIPVFGQLLAKRNRLAYLCLPQTPFSKSWRYHSTLWMKIQTEMCECNIFITERKTLQNNEKWMIFVSSLQPTITVNLWTDCRCCCSALFRQRWTEREKRTCNTYRCLLNTPACTIVSRSRLSYAPAMRFLSLHDNHHHIYVCVNVSLQAYDATNVYANLKRWK